MEHISNKSILASGTPGQPAADISNPFQEGNGRLRTSALVGNSAFGASGAFAEDRLAGIRLSESRPLDWRRKMSDHIAIALLVYTGLQIFVTTSALTDDSASLFPYLALVVLVVGIIPACRYFEHRWNRLSDAQAADPAMAAYFRRDRLGLWLMAIGLPFAITGLFKGLALLFN